MDLIVDNHTGSPDGQDAPVEERPEDILRSAIVSGQLQPNERLVEADVSRQLGIGRSAVRTALALLEHEGLVELERNRGARVRLVPLEEAVEILEVRAVLEGLVVRHVVANATPQEIAELRTIVDEMRQLRAQGDLLAASDRNAVFHRRLSEIGGHATAQRLIDGLRSQLVRFQYRTILLPGRSERSLEEHEEILEAIAAHDPDRAEAAMRLHLSRVAFALQTQGDT